MTVFLIQASNTYYKVFLETLEKKSEVHIRKLASIIPSTSLYRDILPRAREINQIFSRVREDLYLFKTTMKYCDTDGRMLCACKKHPDVSIIPLFKDWYEIKVKPEK